MKKYKLMVLSERELVALLVALAYATRQSTHEKELGWFRELTKKLNRQLFG